MPKERISVRLRSLTDSGQLPRGCYHTQGRVCWRAQRWQRLGRRV